MKKINKLTTILEEQQARDRVRFVEKLQGLTDDVIMNRLLLCFHTRKELEQWEKLAFALTGRDQKMIDVAKSEAKFKDGQTPYYFLHYREWKEFSDCTDTRHYTQ